MSVFTKILEARRQIGSISKKKKQGIPYQFQGIEEVTHAFKQVFDEVGLLFLPANVSVDLVGNSWVLGYQMTFVDPDDDSSWSSHWGATIPVEEYRKNGPSLIDEKATGKAHSYAVKYFLMKTFMVTDKDDAAHDIDGTPNRSAETAQQLTQRLDDAKPKTSNPAKTTSIAPDPKPIKNAHGYLFGIIGEWTKFNGYEGEDNIREKRLSFARANGFQIESFSELTDPQKIELALLFKQDLVLKTARQRKDGDFNIADEQKLIAWATNNRADAKTVENLTAEECDKILATWKEAS